MKIIPGCLSLLGWLAVPLLFAAESSPVSPPSADDYADRILTPPAPAAPRINGPALYGQRPGRPFLYAVPATGDRPMTFSARGLPPGLRLDPATGRITGAVANAGDYPVTLEAHNARGDAIRAFRIVIGEKIALTPAMGWNSWNSWARNVDQDKVLRSARALVATGLANHGWSYVNIDDTWQGARTGADHALQANAKFPDMKGLCDELHAMGLKAGIYSTPWITSYANFPGGGSDEADGAWTPALANRQGHHFGRYSFAAADSRQWAAWGFDYLKYDWNPNDVEHTAEMADALRQSGRDFVFSLSNSAPFAQAAEWARLANSWRTTGDITDSWGDGRLGWNNGVAKIGFRQDRWTEFAGAGHWNDPDMLVVGIVSVGSPMHRTRLTPDEQYTHLSLWCLLSAPLLIGCDLERIDPFTLSLLSNDEVLALDQDALGRQARQIAGPEFPSAAPTEPAAAGGADSAATASSAPAGPPGGHGLVYAKPLADGTVAVGLFNIGPREETVSVSWDDLHVAGPRIVRDLWRQQDLGIHEKGFSASVPSHGVVLLKVAAAP